MCCCLRSRCSFSLPVHTLVLFLLCQDVLVSSPAPCFLTFVSAVQIKLRIFDLVCPSLCPTARPPELQEGLDVQAGRERGGESHVSLPAPLTLSFVTCKFCGGWWRRRIVAGITSSWPPRRDRCVVSERCARVKRLFSSLVSALLYRCGVVMAAPDSEDSQIVTPSWNGIENSWFARRHTGNLLWCGINRSHRKRSES